MPTAMLPRPCARTQRPSRSSPADADVARKHGAERGGRRARRDHGSRFDELVGGPDEQPWEEDAPPDDTPDER